MLVYQKVYPRIHRAYRVRVIQFYPRVLPHSKGVPVAVPFPVACVYIYMCSCVLYIYSYMAVCQNLVPLVNIKIAGKWMFIPLKMVLIGIDPYPYLGKL